jgi:hypothetical protein
VPDLPSGEGKLVLVGMRHTDPASSQQLEPRNLSTTTPLVINRSHNPVDLAEKANPCLRNEEHKQELERNAALKFK